MKSAEFLKIAEILSKSHKITVEEGEGWAANIKQRRVFYRKEDLFNLSEEHILGLILHEIAHIHYTTDTPTPPKNEELMHTTMNMLEDIAIEHIISGDYPNAGDILKSTEKEAMDTLVRMLPKMDHVSVHEKALLYGAIRFRGRGYAFGIQEYEKLGEEIGAIMGKRDKEIYERKTTKDLMPLAEEIVDLLIKKAGEPTPDQKRQMRKGAEEHTNAQKTTENDAAKKQLIKKLGGKGFSKGDAHIDGHVSMINEVIDQADTIGKKIRTILKRNNAMEFGGRYRTGKLLAKRFIRVKALKDRRPFARRIIKSNQSYAFAVAADVSGSMFQGRGSGHSSADYALSSLQMVAEALRKAGIPRTMIIFGVNAVIVGPMNKLKVFWEQINSEKNLRKANDSGTNIGKAMRVATKELSKIKAERKIMVILTDGSSSMFDMQEAHKEATKEGIECLGITIGSDAYEMNTVFGKEKNYHIQDTKATNEISPAFTSILKKTITKSG